ncbi:MAG TPA: ATP-binding protein [bacterium]|nr:ATP-binding protein [bacterium]
MARAKGIEISYWLHKQFIKYNLLIINEWLLFPISEDDTKLLLWIIDRRHNNRTTIILSQYESVEWFEQMLTLVAAETITDQLSVQVYKIIIKSNKSLRL